MSDHRDGEKPWISGIAAIGWIVSWLLVAVGLVMMFTGRKS